jgi:hypothetical protein
MSFLFFLSLSYYYYYYYSYSYSWEDEGVITSTGNVKESDFTNAVQLKVLFNLRDLWR